jgi:hypothetical protein
MNYIFKLLINLALGIFVVITALLVAGYISLLVDKFLRPQFKNMNDREVVYFGLIAIGLTLIDAAIVRKWIRAYRQGKSAGNKLTS